jgi:pyruvate/2-oxoglutarate/acetoin dehydrogenase E1 component
MSNTTDYGSAIREGFSYLLTNYEEVLALGQGLWSPWYVGNTMSNLDKEFGHERVIDSPVSELACTGVAFGASLCGLKPIVIHPRVDFFVLGIDQLVNQAAKWNHMFGGDEKIPLTVRAIINRGGEQGAQHSQSLASWFAHIPGLRVVMPSTPSDARDLLIAATLCDDPVLYIDDRWCYDREETLSPIKEVDLTQEGTAQRRSGNDATLVGYSYCAWQCEQAADQLAEQGVECDVFDLRVVNPLRLECIYKSVAETGKLLIAEGDWGPCGIGGEIISKCAERGIDFASPPVRLSLPNCPAPTSKPLEQTYYLSVKNIVDATTKLVNSVVDVLS